MSKLLTGGLCDKVNMIIMSSGIIFTVHSTNEHYLEETAFWEVCDFN